MKAASTCALLWLLSGVLWACAGSAAARPGPDDAATHQAVAAHAGGTEVTFDATVVTDPYESGGHERFQVTDPAGDSLEVDHNVRLATSVPAHRGDRIVIHGQLYADPGRVGVHCTHAHTSSGCPNPGWIQLGSNFYE